MLTNKKSILVIEDELPMLKVLIDKLQESGFATLQANNGEEGLGVALSAHPDLILLDLLMPKMDGMSMMEKLRENTWGKNIPVIILTNVSADTDVTIKAIIDLQPAYYLVKSDVKLETIVEKIKEILKTETTSRN